MNKSENPEKSLDLNENKKIISASILAADFTRLGEEVKKVLNAGVDYIHFDVMDHHFVPNLSFGAFVCRALREAGVTAPIDVHLMVKNPESLIDAFVEAKASLITFHPETVSDVAKVVTRIKKSGMEAGLAFNPEKPVVLDAGLARELRLILLMSVNPGFAGQSFIDGSLEKIRSTHDFLQTTHSNAWLGIDGGIKNHNLTSVAKAGANFFVVGSGLFHTPDYTKTLSEMRAAIRT